MSSFTYHPATSVATAIELLDHYGEDTQLLAGGTSVMLLGRLGLLASEHVIGLYGIDELRGITIDESGELRLGTLSTLREIETAPQTRRVAPSLAEAVHQVATVRIRNQATIGGNLAHADPAQDAPPMLIALGAEVEASGLDGDRRLPVEELFTGYFETSLAPSEILTAVVVPPPASETRAGYLKFLPRTEDDYATVSVAAAVEMADGRCTRARVALGAAADTPVRAPGVEAALTGRRIEAGDLHEAALLVQDDIDPISDARGSASYKRDVAVTCVRRMLEQLLQPGEESQ